jgi:hypothetical protein
LRYFRFFVSRNGLDQKRPRRGRVDAMSMTQPIERIEYAEKEVGRYRDDVESLKRDHGTLAKECWVWEDLIAKANFIFDRIMHIDVQVQHCLLVGRCRDEEGLQEKLRDLLRAWLAVSLQVIAQGERLERDYGEVEGLDSLRANVQEARSALTPDDEFFAGDNLSALRDEAVEAHRSGLTEPLLENERTH